MAIAASYFVFGFTYLGLALGEIPGLRIDRAGIAVVGAAATLGFGLLSLPQAARAVDYQTLILLFGMMVVAAHLRISGFFELITRTIGARLHHPKALLAGIVALSGLLSAFLINDVVCVAFTPLVLALCRRTGKRPIPYLIALATASNIGSVATLTGNPQNIIIGSLSHIPYLRFAMRLSPIALVGLVVDYLLILWIYRKDLTEQLSGSGEVSDAFEPVRMRVYRPLLIKSLLVTVGAIVFFLLGKPVAEVALIAAGLLLLGRVRTQRVYDFIDWPLLVMFSGLFVVVAAFDAHIVSHWGLQGWHLLRRSPVVLLSAISVVLSNLVSNVPAVLLFKPVMTTMPDQNLAWLALAMSSTLAGNLTVLGSVANLIVLESSKRAGVELKFREYLKVGIPLTLITTLFGVVWLSMTRY